MRCRGSACLPKMARATTNFLVGDGGELLACRRCAGNGCLLENSLRPEPRRELLAAEHGRLAGHSDRWEGPPAGCSSEG